MKVEYFYSVWLCIATFVAVLLELFGWMLMNRNIDGIPSGALSVIVMRQCGLSPFDVRTLKKRNFEAAQQEDASK